MEVLQTIALLISLIGTLIAVIWKFSKSDSRIENLEKELTDFKEVKENLAVIKTELTSLSQSINKYIGKELTRHENQISRMELEIKSLQIQNAKKS